MDDKKIEDILNYMSRANYSKKKELLMDLYNMGRLDAMQKPTSTSSIKGTIKHFVVKGYGGEWKKKGELCYQKTIGDAYASISIEKRGYKLCEGITLHTTVGGSLYRARIAGKIPLAEVFERANAILLEKSNGNCAYIKDI